MVDGVTEGTNRSVRELYQNPADVAPVSEVADEAWAAANKHILHRPVGKPARRVKKLIGIFPGYVRKVYAGLLESYDG
jgi:hypothetical protein